MIEFVKNYILSICIVGLVSSIIISLSPNGNTEKAIRLVASVFFILAVIAPILTGKFSFSKIELDNILKTDLTEKNSENIRIFNEKASIIAGEEIKNQISLLLKQEKILVNDIKVYVDSINNKFSLNKIDITSKLINKEKIKKLINSKFNISEDIIFIKESE